MIFLPEHCELILAGLKTQTRRLVKAGEEIIGEDVVRWVTRDVHDLVVGPARFVGGKEYAMQPGRGKPGVGHIRILVIRKEHLQEISEEDARAEGAASREAFAAVWDRINRKPGARWPDDPEVWVLTFEVVR